ncbi:MAG: hypothetical protein ACKPE3_13710, partial [Sphaerospermopsis kisseleviana]
KRGIQDMNCQKNVCLFVLAIGLFGIKPADAKNTFTKTDLTNNYQIVTPSSSLKIAQLTEAISPVYGAWKLTYSVNGIVYKGALVMNGYYGVLRVNYFDPNRRQKATVDQVIKLMSSSQGLVLLGANPVYAGTSIPHPTYAADNFLFSIQPDGSLVAVNCDDKKQCSYVDVEFVK